MKVVDAIILGRNPRKAVRFPASLIPPELQDKVTPEEVFLLLSTLGLTRLMNSTSASLSLPRSQMTMMDSPKLLVAQLPDSDYNHFSALSAAGRESRHCCGGTLVIKIDRERTKNILFLGLCLSNHILKVPLFCTENPHKTHCIRNASSWYTLEKGGYVEGESTRRYQTPRSGWMVLGCHKRQPSPVRTPNQSRQGHGTRKTE